MPYTGTSAQLLIDDTLYIWWPFVLEKCLQKQSHYSSMTVVLPVIISSHWPFFLCGNHCSSNEFELEFVLHLIILYKLRSFLMPPDLFNQHLHFSLVCWITGSLEMKDR